MLAEITTELNRKMDHTLELLTEELAAVRTGRASADVLKPVHVDYYGTSTPLIQLASINTPDSQLITVTPFDPSAGKAIEKAINSANMGLNATLDGNTIRVPVPVLTEERRKEMVKQARKLAEENKVAIRNLRRDANERVKKMEKNKEISQDEEHHAEQTIQTTTDKHIQRIDELLKKKEQELLKV